MRLLAVVAIILAIPILFALTDPHPAQASQPGARSSTPGSLYWPVEGVISSGYGFRHAPDRPGNEFHTGIDIATPTGAAVRAIADGTVRFAGTAGNYGNLIILRHKDADGSYETYYGHLESIYVLRAGEIVQAGQIIGLVGSTGRSTGPHLHFEYRVGGRPQDPYALYR